LTKQGQVRVLCGVELQVSPGECVVVRGASGCGKSTLLLALGAMLRPDRGSVTFNGHDIYAMPPHHRTAVRGGEMGFVFQAFHLVPYLTVLENVLVPARNRPSERTHAEELLSRLRIDHRLHHRPEALSMGEQQRTAIARAMINRPQLILADEPTGNLDAENGREVFTALGEFRDAGGSVIVVTHGSEAETIADRSFTLHDGRVTLIM
jgi:ABC-type lipoprotein export system ATPase subunit